MVMAKSENEKYRTVFTNSENVAFSDVSKDKGGNNAGFRPHELIEAGLASCMHITIRMAADKRNIDLGETEVHVGFNREDPENPVLEYRVLFDGKVKDRDRRVLELLLERCPVRSTLSKQLKFRNIAESTSIN